MNRISGGLLRKGKYSFSVLCKINFHVACTALTFERFRNFDFVFKSMSPVYQDTFLVSFRRMLSGTTRPDPTIPHSRTSRRRTQYRPYRYSTIPLSMKKQKKNIPTLSRGERRPPLLPMLPIVPIRET